MKLFKKLNKGFTLVELVVVIAVIAILAAVSVVAYTGITTNAKKTAAMSNARSGYDAWLATAKETDPSTLDIKSGEYWFHVENNQFKQEAHDDDPETTDSPNYTVKDAGEKGLIEYSGE